jgi:hypothetical protein
LRDIHNLAYAEAISFFVLYIQTPSGSFCLYAIIKRKQLAFLNENTLHVC